MTIAATQPERIYPAQRIARWLSAAPVESLAEHLMHLLTKNGERLHRIQKLLQEPIPAGSIEAMTEMYLALDAEQWFAGTLLAEANAMLDKAEEACLVPCGTAVPVINEETSQPIPGKFKTYTEPDRTVKMASDVAAFRRFRDEMKVVSDVIQNRIFNLKGLARLGGGQ